jgi:2-aminoadipate transaminase
VTTAPPPAQTQNALRPGFVELAYGEPDPRLLPVDAVHRAATAALEREGPGAIAYGEAEGPRTLRAALAQRITAQEGVPVEADDVVVTGGVSQALEQAVTVFAGPDDAVLVESPTYNLAVGILRDHAVEIIGLRHDGGGLDLADLEATLTRLRAGGRTPRLLYAVPTFHNPTGACLSPDRRAALVALARREDLLILEDDVYRELAYDGDAPPSLWSLDPEAPVLRLGTFSKSLTPGLRVGWVTGRDDLRRRFVGAGVIESGGCPTQFAACVAAALLENGDYEPHVAALRAAFTTRRDALAAALRDHLPAGCDFVVPAGGYFLWVRLPKGLTATALLPSAERRRVSYLPGARFSMSGEDGHIRLAFSLYDETALTEGARRLGAAVRDALGDIG